VTALLPLISAYKPVDIELDTKFLPFIPEYIPAIGEIDAVLKPEPL
jgi:intraflagellar transport protein 46